MPTNHHRARGIINHLQDEPRAFLLLERRGGQSRYFLEPGCVQVRAVYAAEAVQSGFLAVRDRDLFGEPMTWVYQRKPKQIFTEFPRPQSPREPT